MEWVHWVATSPGHTTLLWTVNKLNACIHESERLIEN